MRLSYPGARVVVALTLSVWVACDPGVDVDPNTPQTGPNALALTRTPLLARANGLTAANDLVVGFDAAISRDEVGDVAGAFGGVVVAHAPLTDAYVLRFADARDADRAARSLRHQTGVRHVAYNAVMTGAALDGAGIGTSPGFDVRGLQWNLSAMLLDPYGSWGTADGVTVAVLDSGAAFEDYADSLGTYVTAPDLAGVDFVPGYDFINDDAHPNDDNGHGTHVTGVIAATPGVASLAPGSSIVAIKVLDADNTGTELALAEGIRYAVDSGADVINMSLSFSPAYFPSQFLQAAVDYAAQNGVVMVAAVGNHNAPVVTYPAAFRDVIAVGATSLDDHFLPLTGFAASPHVEVDVEDASRWSWSLHFLEVAPYSNQGYLVDVVAPAGVIDGDVDGDGYPEAVLAQTFGDRDPSNVGYYFYAGTSQAAAQVSGLAAIMLRANDKLTPYDVRAVLGETAKRIGGHTLSTASGRGRVRAALAFDAAEAPGATRDRPHMYAAIHLRMHRHGIKRVATADVEIVDEQGNPAPHVYVYGTFTGSTYDSDKRRTNGNGIASFQSPPFDREGAIVGFQVDAVAIRHGRDVEIDRPRGFVRIDSYSLEQLSTFASGIGTSPGLIGPGTAPIVIAFDVPGGHGQGRGQRGGVDTLLLPNFSWGMATVPMAVTVEEGWFLDEFPDIADRRVVSYGTGIGTSPMRFDPETSFPEPVVVDDDSGYSIDLLLLTFTCGSGIGTSPGFLPLYPDTVNGPGVVVDPDDLADVLARQWDYWWGELTGSGIGTSPGWTADTGVPESLFDHLSKLMELYIPFGAGQLAAPVANYGSVLEVAGMGLTPEDIADGEGVTSAE